MQDMRREEKRCGLGTEDSACDWHSVDLREGYHGQVRLAGNQLRLRKDRIEVDASLGWRAWPGNASS